MNVNTSVTLTAGTYQAAVMVRGCDLTLVENERVQQIGPLEVSTGGTIAFIGEDGQSYSFALDAAEKVFPSSKAATRQFPIETYGANAVIYANGWVTVMRSRLLAELATLLATQVGPIGSESRILTPSQASLTTVSVPASEFFPLY